MNVACGAESSVALEGAEALVLDDVTHYPWSVAPFAEQIAPELTKVRRLCGVMLARIRV